MKLNFPKTLEHANTVISDWCRVTGHLLHIQTSKPHTFCLAACWRLDCENTIYHKMSDEFATYIALSDCDPKPLHPLRVWHPWFWHLVFLNIYVIYMRNEHSWEGNIIYRIISKSINEIVFIFRIYFYSYTLPFRRLGLVRYLNVLKELSYSYQGCIFF